MFEYRPMKRLELNTPVNYTTRDCDIALDGHFAYRDEDGYPYVFENGGTSFTRKRSQVIRCRYVWALTEEDQAVIDTNNLERDVLKISLEKETL